MSDKPELFTMTAVFEYDVRKFPTNPFHVDTPFGRPIVIARGNLADECDALREKLEAAGIEPCGMSEWHLIETAPKDGRSILAYLRHPRRSEVLPYDYRITSMRWDECTNHWRSDCHSFMTFSPTHWMPLPEPPP